MTNILVKVYGHIWPAPKALFRALEQAAHGALPSPEAPVVACDRDMVLLSFEGLYFPLDDVLETLEAHLDPTCQGKLDYLELEAWTLSRYEFVEGRMRRRTLPLNHVLDHSGH